MCLTLAMVFIILCILFFYYLIHKYNRKINSLKEHHKIRVKELKEEEKKFKIFLKNIPAISCSTDINSKILFIEGCVKELTGFSKEDFLKGCILWESLIVPEDIEKCKYVLQQLYSVPNANFQYSFRIRTKDGRLKWLQRVAENVTDSKGNIQYVHGITYDITKVKRDEEKIKELYYMNELTLNSVAEGIIVTDLEGNISNINNAAVKMLKLEGENILGKNIHELVHTKNVSKERCYILKAIKEGRSEKVANEVFYNRYGLELDVECSITPLLHGDIVKGGVICFSDIGERKAFERELYKLLSVINQAEVSIVITDLKGNIIYVNKGFEDITGYTFAEVLGKNPKILKSGKHDKEFYKELWHTLTNGETWRGKFINKRKDGSLYYEDGVLFPLVDLEGRIVNYAAIKKEITREVELEEQLKLTQKLEAMGQMVGGIAHDFNNILTVMNGYTELLMMKINETHEFFKPVKGISSAVERATSLVRHLLTFGRKQEIKPQPLDINNIVRELNPMLKRLVPENINFTVKPKEKISLLWADVTQLEQIILNLVINARDAVLAKETDEIKEIIIETDEIYVSHKKARNIPFNIKEGNYVKLSVSDNGIGIKKELLLRIFEPFFTTKGTGKGTGLGLSTVYGIVTQNKGFIDVKSQEGKGSTFEVYLPCYEFPELNENFEKENIELKKNYSETLLFVEDDEEIVKMMKKGLENLGYKIFVAVNGKKGFEIFKKNAEKIDVIVSDIVMPETDGLQMYEKIKSISNKVKIIFTTGYAEKDIYNLKDSQNVLFLNKPYKLSELNEKIREILDK